jgi:hypothetical protein
MNVTALIKEYIREHGIKNHSVKPGTWMAPSFVQELQLGNAIAFFYFMKILTNPAYRVYNTNLALRNSSEDYPIPFFPITANANDIWQADFAYIAKDKANLVLTTGALTIHPTAVPPVVAGELHIYAGQLNYLLLTPLP